VSSTTGIFVADLAVSLDVIVVGAEGPTNSYSGVLYGLMPPAPRTGAWPLIRRGFRAGRLLAQGSLKPACSASRRRLITASSAA
jgi:hypothetical protein